MEMSKYTLKDLLLIGIKSEIEAEKVYRSTANKAKNPFLKAKLNALAEEENNHKKILEELFHELYPREDIKLPENPEFLPEFPEIKIFAELNGVTDVRKIIEQAMKAELSAKKYYEEIAEMVKEEKIKKLMLYMAKIEEGHYFILQHEYREIEEFESIMHDEDYMQFDARF
ncbi:MAG: ferritin family protein [Thermoplasmata archaeon]|nr:ferritin family protein [Thermoplasmata archaeon]